MAAGIFWEQLNPDSWTASGWGAAGGWFSGVAMATSVWFAVKVAREAQQSAMHALSIELAEEGRREQLRAVGALWTTLRGQQEIIDTIADRWHAYASADAAYQESSAHGADNSATVRDYRTATLEELHDFQPEALALAASVKDVFLEPMWTVTDLTVRDELEKLHKSYRQLSAWIEHIYRNLPARHRLLDQSTGEFLTLVGIKAAISTHSDQLVVRAQERLGRPQLRPLD